MSAPDSLNTAPVEQSEALEDPYRLLVHSVRDYAIFMLDSGGLVKSWNRGAEVTKGYSAEEIIGRHISTFYPPEAQAAGKPAQLLAEAVRKGRVEDEGWRVRKDGTQFWADVVITPLFDAKGGLYGFTKVTRDLTARREAEEALRQSEARFRMLVQSVKDYAIFMLAPNGQIATWNAGAARIKGYSADEVIGKHFSIFYSAEEVASGKTDRELQTALEAGKFEEEGWRIRKDGSRFWANVVIEPLRDQHAQLLGFAKVTRDLTERRAAETERLRLQQAQETIQLRDEFLSIASHELKTPLTAVQLQLQNLVKATASSDEVIRKRVERAYRSGELLADLVETLLDVSRMASGTLLLSYSKFDLAQAAQEVVERFKEQAALGGSVLTLQTTGPVLGEWDRLRIEQIFMNLVSNALKYASGTPIGLSVWAEADRAMVTITDQGPGISPSDWERVFERFERAASMRHFGGMGLGLYVARQITEAHHGAISVHSAEPRGARFVVSLPRAPRSTEAAAEVSR